MKKANDTLIIARQRIIAHAEMIQSLIDDSFTAPEDERATWQAKINGISEIRAIIGGMIDSVGDDEIMTRQEIARELHKKAGDLECETCGDFMHNPKTKLLYDQIEFAKSLRIAANYLEGVSGA